MTARWVYDNSEANARNPFRPPRPVWFGQRTSDEMAELWFQVVPRTAPDRQTLTRAMQTHLRPENIKGYEMMLRAEPDNASLHDDVALLTRRRAISKAPPRISPRRPHSPWVGERPLQPGSARLLQGRHQEARSAFQRAIEIDPSYANAHRGLGIVLYRDGLFEEAARAYEGALQFAPYDVSVHHNFGVLLQAQGKVDDAISHYRDTLRLDGRHPDAHHGLALQGAGQPRRFHPALPRGAAIRSQLAGRDDRARMAVGDRLRSGHSNSDEAIALTERALQSAGPRSWTALDASAVSLASAERFREAADRAR